MVRAGRDLPMVKTMLSPEAWGDEPSMPQAYRDLYSYCNAVMEPWDGPAAVCGFGGRWAIAGMDRNGLRPMRYTITKDGLLFAGSETGRSEEHTSELQSLMRISYDVVCLNKNNK